MTESKSGEKNLKKAGKSAANALSDEELTALREHIEQRKAAARPGSRAEKAAEAERAVLAKIAEMPAEDRAIAERIHAIVKANAPALSPKLWYGMPAFANEDGDIVCFFQNAQKFKARYGTLGFSDKAKLDKGRMWPTSFALKNLTAADEARIGELVKKAVG